MTPLDIFKVTLGQVPAIFVVTKTYNFMASQDLSIHVCVGVFSRPQGISNHVCVNHSRYFMPKPDLFLTLRFIIVGKLLLDANTGRGMSAEYSKIIGCHLFEPATFHAVTQTNQ